MTIKKIDSNIKELERRLAGSESDYSAMVIRNCITTMRMKRKEARRAERRRKREENNNG